ncbi:mitotic fidelity of chromosome transmission-related protein [Malassezia pachydermatis]|uniref:CENP-C homolog n=1 Tax=Malassezia pachydermatis TaxID=77020 RepID=A0A0M9VMR8_9BASI|nr:inner kinetochore protein mif2 [Malassezia pachydermatis]KOS12552.1 inner kinetochore protein mif2 [Malassezia pachydermatis]
MSVAPARRFHEEGLGSRTGLRIGSIRLDEQGHEDLDAFFAESKRVLEWMERSDDERSESAASATRSESEPRDEVKPPATAEEDVTTWDRRASRISEWAARSAVGSVRTTPRVVAAAARPSLLPRAEESLWNSTVDISRAERTFQLSAMAGDVSAMTVQSAAPVEEVWASTSQRPSPNDTRLSHSRARMMPQAPSMSTPLAGPSQWPRVSEVSTMDTSRIPDTDMPSFLRPEASILPPRTASLSSSRASTPASGAWDAAPASPPLPMLDALDPLPGPDEPAWPPEESQEPPKKRGRGRPRKDASMPPPRGRPGRPPGRQKPAQKIVENIYDPPSWQLDNPTGLRRGKRHRIAPLQWWRGERALYGRPDEREDDEVAASGLVAPVLKQVIRVPRAPGEGTFSGMRRFRAKPSAYMQQMGRERPEGMRLSPVAESDEDENMDDTASDVDRSMYIPPETGWDADTDPYGRVMDVDQNMEVTMRIACTSDGIRPRPAFNQKFSYEKIFGVGDFMAAGVLVIPRGGEKPTKPSKDNNYTFVVLQGAVQVMVHRTRFVIAPGGMFLVPKGNTYQIRNVSHREARIFFAQARNMQTPLTPVMHAGETAFAHGGAHVHVEPPAAHEDGDDDNDNEDGESTDSDDADASGDFALRRA